MKTLRKKKCFVQAKVLSSQDIRSFPIRTSMIRILRNCHQQEKGLSKAKSTPVKVKKKKKEEVEIIEITSSPISVSSAEEINTPMMNYFCAKRELSFSPHQSPSPSSDSSLPSLSPPPKQLTQILK